jgi:hypothetical protein
LRLNRHNTRASVEHHGRVRSMICPNIECHLPKPQSGCIEAVGADFAELGMAPLRDPRALKGQPSADSRRDFAL